jgi:hypothetical protein
MAPDDRVEGDLAAGFSLGGEAFEELLVAHPSDCAKLEQGIEIVRDSASRSIVHKLDLAGLSHP